MKKNPIEPDVYKPSGNPKRDRPFDVNWFRSIPNRAYTQDEWIAKFKTELTHREQFDFVKSILPREVKGEITNVVRLLIEGVQARPAIEAREIRQLEEPDDEGE